jgi:hypothetical protein
MTLPAPRPATTTSDGGPGGAGRGVNGGRGILWLARVAAIFGMLGTWGCDTDECTGGTSQCNGDVLEKCQDSSGGVYLTKRLCEPGVCIPGGDGGPFCALDREPDPRCPWPAQAVCDGATLVTCHTGYATATFDCLLGESQGDVVSLAPGTSGTCVHLTGGSQCVAEAKPDPACPRENDHFSGCSGNDNVDCRYGYVVRRTPCGSAFCREDLTAVCSLTEAPDPACAQNSRTSSFCAGDTLVHCGWGYPVSEEVCSPSEACAPFSVVSSVCTPRE